MESMTTVLLWAFIAAQLTALFVLGYRNWWRGAPAFMAFLWLSSLQAVVGAVGYPHGSMDALWWHWTWMPVELGVVLAAGATAVEVLWARSSYAMNFHRFSARLIFPFLTWALVGWKWYILPHATWFGWFVLAREWAWVGMTVLVGLVVAFFAMPALDPKPEPRSLVHHSLTFSALLLSHSLMAPLVRLGYDKATVQHVYMAIVIVCCTSWLTLCCPTSPASFVGVDLRHHPSPDVSTRNA